MIGVHRALIDFTRGRIVKEELGPQLTRDTRAQARRAFELLEAGFGDYARRPT